MTLNRRGALKMLGTGLGASMIKPPPMPRADMFWPPGVRTHFIVERDDPRYCLTIDDGWRGPLIAPFIKYLLNKDAFPFTWFANGTGIRDIRNGYLNPDSPYRSPTTMWFWWARCTVGYHTMLHPAIEDQRKNYNRSRWIEDYEEWLEIALESFAEAQEKSLMLNNFSIIRPYARAAGGYFSDPFMEMCDIKGLTPYGWSADPYTLNRGAKIGGGDIFLTHFRDSEWQWFSQLAALQESGDLIAREIGMMEDIEKTSLSEWFCNHFYFRKHRTCE